jgi:transcriptional regulator with XRE-family HTH domain
VLKLIRESVGLTQVRLAELLGVDLATLQGWESGRRPLTALRAADLLRLRGYMIKLGARPATWLALSDALEADLIIAEIVDAGCRTISYDAHPLSSFVHKRPLTRMITWPFTGIPPTQLKYLAGHISRRGPVADRPVLSDEERTRFFDHLLLTADSNTDENAALLRRQAIYLLGFDERAGSADWLCTEQRRAWRAADRQRGHVPSWVAVRSCAMPLTHSGNRDPLRAFVQEALKDQQQEAANLNYWAYWVGEIPHIEPNDAFMVDTGLTSWHGRLLMEHMLDRLRPRLEHIELAIHTLWALLLTHPKVLDTEPTVRAHTGAHRAVGRGQRSVDTGAQGTGYGGLRCPARRGPRRLSA